MGRAVGYYTNLSLEAYSDASNLAQEVFSAIRTVVSFNAQKKFSTRYEKVLKPSVKVGLKKSLAQGLGLGSLFLVLYLGGYALAFWYGSTLLIDKLITSGQIVNCFFAVLIGAFSLGALAPDLQAFTNARSASHKLHQAIDKQSLIDSYSETGDVLPKVDGKLEFKNIQFHYPTRPEQTILHDFNLTVEAGKTVALVGPSGSGKSTIVALTERFYDPDPTNDGTILLDGKPLSSLNIRWLRSQIGLVGQEPVLFEGTIADNVAFGLMGIGPDGKTRYIDMMSEEEKIAKIEESCKLANAHDFIMKLPQGYQTLIGTQGLSGGQKQRIAIARAIVKNPRILLLDEATSSLDNYSERVVQAALERVSTDRTTLIIAHRLSTVRNADKIVVMADGKIIEIGSHDELMSSGGTYKRLVMAQQLDGEDEANTHSHQKMDSSVIAKKTETSQAIADVIDTAKPKSIDIESANLDSKQRKLTTWQVIGRIGKLNRPELWWIIGGFIGAAVSGLVFPTFSVVFSKLLNVFTETDPVILRRESNFWAAMFVVLGIVMFFANFAQYFMFGLSSEYLTERVRRLVFTNLLLHDIAYFDDPDNATGALTSRLSTDAQSIQGVSGQVFGSFLNVSVNLVGGFIIAMCFSWKLTLVVFTTMPVLVFAGLMRIKIVTFFHDKAKKSYQRSAQIACEAVAAIRTVASLSREKNVEEIYEKELEQPVKDGYKNAFLGTMLFAASQCVSFLSNALAFWYGGQLIMDENLGLDAFFTAFFCLLFGSMSAGRVFAWSPDFSKGRDAGESIIKMIENKPKISVYETAQKRVLSKPAVKGEIIFKNVTFSYPTRSATRVLKGLDLKIEAGQFVAFVGASGCGKSTTIQLIERFYDPSSGQILLDGVDLRDINTESLRDSIAIVSQEPNLFDMTVRENICLGLKELPSQGELEDAARMANILEFIESLPDGFDSTVGSKVSGGQKQRICICRALLKKPKILLLDEGTSALDNDSEAVVEAALKNIVEAGGRTTISIAHRLSTIQHADKIFVFENGVVVEEGRHMDLIEKRGVYYDMAKLQMNLS